MTDNNTNTAEEIEQKGIMAKHTNLKKATCATVMAGLLAAGGVMAYLTSTDAAENNFSLAEKIEIDIVEPNWVEADAAAMLPTMTVAKDPAITNISDVEGWIAMKVEVPTMNVKLADESSPSSHELVTYSVNDGWTETGAASYDATTNMTTHTYLYSDALAAGSTSKALFDNITLINLADGQIAADNLNQSLNVYGYAIQTHGFDNVGAAWAAYQGQNS